METRAINPSYVFPVKSRNLLHLLLPLIAGCGAVRPPKAPPATTVDLHTAPMTPFQQKVITGLRDELNWGTGYDAAYLPIPYPNGDVPREKGACTDVVIRAYRAAGLDLQKLIHEDIAGHWACYPHHYHLDAPDPNIDHRRVPNQKVYFERHWKSITLSLKDPAQWQPADVVQWRLPTHATHTGVITERLDDTGLPYVIENIGSGPVEDDALHADWTIIGHFRYVPRDLKKVARAKTTGTTSKT
jgi:uncharacterized protein YijF (DUF1287 family)